MTFVGSDHLGRAVFTTPPLFESAAGYALCTKVAHNKLESSDVSNETCSGTPTSSSSKHLVCGFQVNTCHGIMHAMV